MSLVLLGPIAIAGAEAAGANLPDWLTAQDSNYLTGGISDSKLAENLSLEGARGGKLQSSVNAEIENHIPLKFHALLGNAAWQRFAIATANAPFAFECYPTFYGGTKLYIPAIDALTVMPTTETAKTDKKLKRYASSLSSLAKDYPDVKFIVYLAEDPATSPSNPAQRYVSNPQTVGDAASIMQDGVKAGNVAILHDEHLSTQEYYQDYFKSDHHWNILGAIDAYDDIAEELDLNTFPNCVTKSVNETPYYGHTARAALDLVGDDSFDVDFSFADVRDSNGKSIDSIRKDYAPASQKWTFYDTYYPNYKHLEGPGGQRGLVIGDSYADALKLPLALQLSSLDASRELHGDSGKIDRYNTGALRDQIENTKPDVVFLVSNTKNAARLLDRHPDFLK